MKVMIGKKEKNIPIPSEILKQAGLNSTDELELHISDGMVFMAKKQVCRTMRRRLRRKSRRRT